MDWFGSDIWVTWVAIGVALGVLELTSGGLLFLMLGIAAFGAAASSPFVGVEWQLVVFGTLTALLLLSVRPPIVARIHNGPNLPSGDQGMVGRVAKVTKEVTHMGGRIEINDVSWSARPNDSEEVFAVGEIVTITAIDGAVAIVNKEGK